MNRFAPLIATLFAALPAAGFAVEPNACKVALTQDPLVMRIGKDEFRIAFGLDGAGCRGSGCSGLIKYRTTWQAEDGTRNTEDKTVRYEIPEDAERSLTVDRSYFDEGEAQHTVEVVNVDVAQISCSNAPVKVVGR